MSGTGLSLTGDYLQRLSGGATLEQTQAVLNDVINRLNNILQTQAFSDTQTKRYIQGYSPGRWPGGDIGIAISAAGDDVTSIDFNKLIFAWDFSTNYQYFRGGRRTIYDPTTGKDVGMDGILPNGKGGSAWAKDNQSVDNAFGN